MARAEKPLPLPVDTQVATKLSRTRYYLWKKESGRLNDITLSPLEHRLLEDRVENLRREYENTLEALYCGNGMPPPACRRWKDQIERSNAVAYRPEASPLEGLDAAELLVLLTQGCDVFTLVESYLASLSPCRAESCAKLDAFQAGLEALLQDALAKFDSRSFRERDVAYSTVLAFRGLATDAALACAGNATFSRDKTRRCERLIEGDLAAQERACSPRKLYYCSGRLPNRQRNSDGNFGTFSASYWVCEGDHGITRERFSMSNPQPLPLSFQEYMKSKEARFNDEAYRELNGQPNAWPFKCTTALVPPGEYGPACDPIGGIQAPLKQCSSASCYCTNENDTAIRKFANISYSAYEYLDSVALDHGTRICGALCEKEPGKFRPWKNGIGDYSGSGCSDDTTRFDRRSDCSAERFLANQGSCSLRAPEAKRLVPIVYNVKRTSDLPKHVGKTWVEVNSFSFDNDGRVLMDPEREYNLATLTIRARLPDGTHLSTATTNATLKINGREVELRYPGTADYYATFGGEGVRNVIEYGISLAPQTVRLESLLEEDGLPTDGVARFELVDTRGKKCEMKKMGDRCTVYATPKIRVKVWPEPGLRLGTLRSSNGWYCDHVTEESWDCSVDSKNQPSNLTASFVRD